MSGKIIPFCNGKGNSKSFISRFVSLITPQYIGITAKQIGFIKRKANLNPSKFVEALVMAAGKSCNMKIASIKECYASLARSGEDLYDKPFHNRLRQDGSVAMMMFVLARLQNKVLSTVNNTAVKELLQELNDCGLYIEDFFLHDGTYWHVNGELADEFPGTRSAEKGKGKAKKLTYTTLDPEGNVVTEEKAKNAQIGLQVTWSMLHECVVDLGIGGATENEKNYVFATAAKKVLHLFDSGYVSYEMYSEIKKTGELIGKLRSNSAGKIVSCHMGKKDLTEHFKDKKLSDASVRHYLEHRVMDLIVEFKGEIYRVIRFFSKKDQKVQYLITSIRKKNIKAEVIMALYKLRWQIERKFMDLKSGSNLRGANTRIKNIVYVMLFASLIASLIKTLVAYAIREKLKKDASMYKISVRTYSWFDRLIKALFRNNLKTVKSIIYKMANSKGDYTMSHQSKDKIRDLKTLKSTFIHHWKLETVPFGTYFIFSLRTFI